jgi:hypothetical protein
MKMSIRVKGNFLSTIYSGRTVEPPQGDKTATVCVFGDPYTRVRQDGEGLFVMQNGERKSVEVVLS